MFKNVKTRLPVLAGSGLGLVALSQPAHAAIDVSEVVTAIESAATAVGLIAAAVLIVYAGVKAWKLARAAM